MTIGAHRQGLGEAMGANTGYALAAPARLAPLAQPASTEDSGYLRYLKAVVAAMDAAMIAEGVDGDVRDRIIDRVIGTPPPD